MFMPFCPTIKKTCKEYKTVTPTIQYVTNNIENIIDEKNMVNPAVFTQSFYEVFSGYLIRYRRNPNDEALTPTKIIPKLRLNVAKAYGTANIKATGKPELSVAVAGGVAEGKGSVGSVDIDWDRRKAKVEGAKTELDFTVQNAKTGIEQVLMAFNKIPEGSKQMEEKLGPILKQIATEILACLILYLHYEKTVIYPQTIPVLIKYSVLNIFAYLCSPTAASHIEKEGCELNKLEELIRKGVSAKASGFNMNDKFPLAEAQIYCKPKEGNPTAVKKVIGDMMENFEAVNTEKHGWVLTVKKMIPTIEFNQKGQMLIRPVDSNSLITTPSSLSYRR